jgi:hypothetical protein
LGSFLAGFRILRPFLRAFEFCVAANFETASSSLDLYQDIKYLENLFQKRKILDDGLKMVA